MGNLNTLQCGSDIKNTGFGTCILDFKAISGAFIVPRSLEFDAAEIADLRQTLTDAAMADKGERIYPFHGFEAITDNTEDPTFQTMASGRQTMIKEGNYNWVMQFIDGGLCLSNKLRSFNNGAWAALFYDQEFKLFGYRSVKSTGEEVLKGVPLDNFYTYPWKANDWSNVSQYRTLFGFKPGYINEGIGFVVSDFPLSEIQGVKDVVLNVTTPLTLAGAVVVSAQVSCGGDDMHSQFGTELAAVGAWKATNKTTGAAIPIATVTATATGWTVTLTVADANYPATGETLTLALGEAQDLQALQVEGYEGLPLTLTVPATARAARKEEREDDNKGSK